MGDRPHGIANGHCCLIFGVVAIAAQTLAAVELIRRASRWNLRASASDRPLNGNPSTDRGQRAGRTNSCGHRAPFAAFEMIVLWGSDSAYALQTTGFFCQMASALLPQR
jgi:hypothetical protein